jgi:diacylglycerol kinase (ATP)
MKLYFIVNPAAKNGRCKKVWKRLEKVLRKKHISYEVFFTEKQGDGKQIARQIVESTSETAAIIAVGGDGTVHEVANGVFPFKHGIVGYIPAGTGNDFSRGIRIPNHPRKALEHILLLLKKHCFSTYDIGQFAGPHVQEGMFVNNLGCGFDAKISRKVNRSKLKSLFNRLSLGKFVYVFYLVKELIFYKPAKVVLQIDGEKHLFERTWLVTISNHPYYGGGMKIAPSAKSDDSLFHIIVVDQISRLKILLLFVTVFWGGHTKMKEVKVFAGKHIHIHTSSLLPLHADGENIGSGSVTVCVQENALSVIAQRQTS